jgi:hypothetical protein
MNYDEQLTADRQTAFQLLREIVDENQRLGRRSYGASLKPQLIARTNNGFAEVRLQYSNFREFLSRAAAMGYISLHPAPRGPDRIATPPGEDPPEPQERTTRRLPRIKWDYWDCFVDWDPGWIRVYDKLETRPRKLPEHSAPLEPVEYADMRAAVAADTESTRFVRINPIEFDEHVSWMRGFAEQEPDPALRSRLVAAISDPRPARAFTLALQSVPEARWRWQAARHAQVERRIQQWAEDAGLAIEMYEPQESPEAVPVVETSGESGSAGDDRLARLRNAAHAVIDRMSEAELGELRLPLGHLFD